MNDRNPNLVCFEKGVELAGHVLGAGREIALEGGATVLKLGENGVGRRHAQRVLVERTSKERSRIARAGFVAKLPIPAIDGIQIFRLARNYADG